MPSILRPIEESWNSDDPGERIKGFLGKFAVEGGLFAAVATAITLAAALLRWSVAPEFTFGTRSLTEGYVYTWVGSILLCFRIAWCRIIERE